MPRRPRNPYESRAPHEDLREAFDCHRETCGYRWHAKAEPIGPSPEDRRYAPRVMLKLTGEDAAALAGLIRGAAERHKAGQDKSVGTAEVAAILNVTTSTIRAWLARGGPKENPFPQPRKVLGRSRWRRSEIDAWRCSGESRPEQPKDG